MEPSQCVVLLVAQMSNTSASGSVTENFCSLLPAKKNVHPEVQAGIAFIIVVED